MVLDIKLETGFGINLVTSFPGWKKAHSKMNQIDIYDTTWRTSQKEVAITYYGWTSDIVFCIAVFLLFGTTRDIRARYWQLILMIARPFGCLRARKEVEPHMSDMKFGTAPGNKRYA